MIRIVVVLMWAVLAGCADGFPGADDFGYVKCATRYSPLAINGKSCIGCNAPRAAACFAAGC